MIISVNWLKKYTDIDISIDELATLIGERLVEIEEVIDLGERYKGIVVARAEKVYKHPNADKLNVVEINDGGINSDVSRLENGLVQVVCGAPNVREGMLVAWIPPGATVPASFGDTEPFVLDARELRGVVSNGMLASGKELAINNDHSGIIDIEGNLAPGAAIADALELNDYLLDIENKSLTHRPDTFGVIGFAREVAAIQGKPFKSPDWLLVTEPTLADIQREEGVLQPTVAVEDPALCPRYEAVVIAGVDSKKQSPLVIQSYLKRVGVRPISAVVDVTNYLMLTTGHPLHAFDYDAFLRIQDGGEAPSVVVRSAREGEKLNLLDGRTVSLAEGDILICAGATPVALAGAMGGSETEVTEDTKNILLESATFNLYNLRNTSMRHGVFTDAVTRFTKGQAAEQTAPVLASATRMLCDIAGGSRASEIIDAYPGRQEQQPIAISLVSINSTLGSHFSIEEIKHTLISIECTVTPGDDNTLLVSPPYWRVDLHIPEDIIEEIGRLNGFNTLIPVLPERSYSAVMPAPFEQFKSSLRQNLVRGGANEVLTYSFVPGQLIKAGEQNTSDAYRIVNAISPELQFYRTSLMPSLLDKVNGNLRSGYDKFALFEINKVHVKGSIDQDDSGLPKEHSRLAFVIAATDKAATEAYRGAPYYQAKYYLQSLLMRQKVTYTLEPLHVQIGEVSDPAFKALVAPYEPKRSALIRHGDAILGVIGEPKRTVVNSMKLPGWCAAFELLLDEVFSRVTDESAYKPLSRFPGTERDICLRIAAEISYQRVVDVILAELQHQPYESSLIPVDIYQKTREDDFKQVTVRIALVSHKETITTESANSVVDKVVAAAQQELKAELV